MNCQQENEEGEVVLSEFVHDECKFESMLLRNIAISLERLRFDYTRLLMISKLALELFREKLELPVGSIPRICHKGRTA